MAEITSVDTVWYNAGLGFAYKLLDPSPNYHLTKMMPCGHTGLWVVDRWVCQTCWSWQKEE